MKNFYWLVKREFWEHRGGFLWTPVITAAVVVIIDIMLVILGEVLGGRHDNFNLIWRKLATASPEDLRQAGNLLDFVAFIPAVIVSIVLFFVLFGYCMKTLSTDRKDRSILFWKSLPLSDLSTVLSKAFSAVIMAPVIATIASVIAAILIYVILAISASFHGLNFGEVLWTLPHPGSVIVSIIGVLPIYMVWMLPSVGWLMLCSAWSRGRVSSWAVALPFALGAIITWIGAMSFDSLNGWFWNHIVLRVILSVFPGSWLWGNSGMSIFHANYDSGHGWQTHGSMADALSRTLTPQYHLLLTPEFLWGALAGFIMIAIAIWLRRWRTEL